MKLEAGHGMTVFFTQEFKLEAVRLVRDRGIAIDQASRDLEPLRPNAARPNAARHEQ